MNVMSWAPEESGISSRRAPYILGAQALVKRIVCVRQDHTHGIHDDDQNPGQGPMPCCLAVHGSIAAYC